MKAVDVVWATYKPDSESRSSNSASSGPTATNKFYPTGSDPPKHAAGLALDVPRYTTSSYSPSSAPGLASTIPSYTASSNLPSAPNNPSKTPFGSSTNSTCGPPPSPEIDGFPTADCGSPTFDKYIDDKIGYLNFDNSDYSGSLQDFAPGLGDVSPSDNDGFGPTRRRLSRRFGLPKFLTRIVNVRTFRSLSFRCNAYHSHVLKDVAKDGLAKVGEGIKTGIQQVGQAILNASAISPSINTDIPINITPSKQVDSPWGKALQLFHQEKTSENEVASGEITVYCVQCEITRKIHLGGEARWTIADGW